MKHYTTHLALVSTVLVLATTASFAVDNSQASEGSEDPLSTSWSVPVVQGTSLLAEAPHYGPEKVVGRIHVVVTAYSSTPEQTDDTPFITASGSYVRKGIVAANFLPLGTKIKLPDIYGDEIFVVEDRMHPRKAYNVDIWFASTSEAKNFGIQRTYIEILEG